jgi:Predicted membrane protein (DUF2207)
MSRGLLCLSGALCIICALCAPSAMAQEERILDFHSDIQVQDDGSMLVRETIRVQSARDRIRHGIYRDFPTDYNDRLGRRYVVGFDLLAATRDGAPEEFRTENLSNGKRIYLGRKDYLLPVGEHTYSITYATNRQLGFFRDHDELFWNVNGNGWIFPIEHVSATVRLPEKIPASDVHLGGYTGPQGSMARDFTSEAAADGGFDFATEHPLGPHEGLTVLLMWPKGYVPEPTREEKFRYFAQDNRDVLIAGGGLLVILLYYVVVWFRVGRDPAPGVIMPIYEPPPGFSPAAMRYLVRMGYDNKAFASAVLDMAVKGFLKIEEDAGTYTLSRAKADRQVLTPEEKAAADKLFDGRTEIKLHNENHVAISAAMAALTAWLKTAEQKIYFVTNNRYMIPAVLLSVAMLVGVVSSQGPQQMGVAGFMCLWLSIWSIGVAALLVNVFHLWESAYVGKHLKVGLVAAATFMTLFSIPFVAGEVFGLVVLAHATSVFVVAVFLWTTAFHVLFHHLLKAPTSAGRSVLDKIQGFKMFLGAVEGDHMNRAMPPEQTPAVFEKYLPYALALDVEQAWAEKFSGVLGAAGQMPGSSSTIYSNSWYVGAAGGALGAAGLASLLGGSFSSAISSSASAPGSSGGGGGGGSGGGGGGGGGGGW